MPALPLSPWEGFPHLLGLSKIPLGTLLGMFFASLSLVACKGDWEEMAPAVLGTGPGRQALGGFDG